MRIKRYLVSVLVFIMLIASCSPSAQVTEGERWVIFPGEQAKEWEIGTWFLTSGQTAEYWTPAEADILALEKGLSSYLEKNPERFDTTRTPAWDRLDEYNRQYVGMILDGKRVIFANFFCDSIETDWKKDYVFVMDGGDCFFQFKYDTESAQFFDLQVNGQG